jgi:epoxyqueuosine reductase
VLDNLKSESENFKQIIKNLALSLGFVSSGFTDAGPWGSSDAAASWINHGFHGKMEYLKRHLPKKQSAQSVLNGAKSVFSAAFPYGVHGNVAINPPVAGYACGEDYHLKLHKLLTIVADKIVSLIGGNYRICIDSAPLPERFIAQRAGLGWIGKSGNLISKGGGVNVVLGEIVIDREVAPDKPYIGDCGDCTLCIDACPTSAIIPDKKMVDANRCISYYTTDAREIPPDQIKEKYNGTLFGCEKCVSVCPYCSDYMVEESPISESNYWILPNISFKATFKQSAISFISRGKLLSNLVISSARREDSRRENLIKILKKEEYPAIKENLKWLEKRKS